MYVKYYQILSVLYSSNHTHFCKQACLFGEQTKTPAASLTCRKQGGYQYILSFINMNIDGCTLLVLSKLLYKLYCPRDWCLLGLNSCDPVASVGTRPTVADMASPVPPWLHAESWYPVHGTASCTARCSLRPLLARSDKASPGALSQKSCHWLPVAWQ